MSTVKQLLREIEELRMREHVWLGIREYLEAFTPEGNTATEALIDGVKVPQDIVIDVLADINTDCLGPIQSRIMEIEAAKVDDGRTEKAKSKAKPKAAKKQRARKKS